MPTFFPHLIRLKIVYQSSKYFFSKKKHLKNKRAKSFMEFSFPIHRISDDPALRENFTTCTAEEIILLENVESIFNFQ